MSHMSRLATEIQEQGNDMTFTAPHTPEIRRKGAFGPPMIVPPGGTEPVEYGRPSQVDADLADRYYLDQVWGPSMMLDGLLADDSLLMRWKMLRDTGADRYKITRLITDAKRAGGAFTKADRGTEYHKHAEQVLTGQVTIDQVPDEFRPAVASLVGNLELLGLTVIAAERFVIHDTLRLAGTFDMLVSNPDGVVRVLDIKTGKLSHLGLAMQLYVYATARHYFTQGAALDGSEDIREPKPLCDTATAYVAEVDIDTGSCKIRTVDISHGAELFELTAKVRAAREIKSWGPEIVPTPAVVLSTVDAHFPGTVDVTPDDVVEQPWRDWMRNRIFEILERDGELRLLAVWPEGVPTLRSGDPITLAQATELEAAIGFIEADMGLMFPEFKPGTEPVREVEPPKPARRPTPDEGGTVLQADVEHLNDRAKALDADGRAWLGATLSACTAAKRNIRLNGPGGKLSERRFAISVALVLLGAHADDDLTRALVALAIDDEMQPGHDLGDAIGSLTIDEAKRLARLASAIDDCVITATWSFDGVEIAGDIQSALAA